MSSLEILDSNRVNFLVWRYLRESNYDETALKLQKEWRLDGGDGHDPANLPFARHVKHHALITVLQKGLLSEAYERELQQEDGEIPSNLGVFGPLALSSNAPSPVAAAAADEDTLLDDAGLEISRKRPHEWQNHHDPNESSAKRQRLSNGFEPNENAMDLDGEHELDDEGQAYPSPAEHERPITPIITRGPEEGIQTEKVIDLTDSTAFYTLTEENNSGSANEAILMHCAWNPQDPTILATAGTDALARLWTFVQGPSPASTHETATTPQHVNGHATPQQQQITPPFVSLIATPDDFSSLAVTAMSWTSDGRALALATDLCVDSSNTTNLTITSVDGNESQEFLALEQGVTCLKWNPKNNILLALLTDDDGIGYVNLFTPREDGSMGRKEFFNTSELTGPERYPTLLDAAWVSDNEFVVCGDNGLRSFTLHDDYAALNSKFNILNYHSLIQNMAYDARSQLIATGSNEGRVEVWKLNGSMIKSFPAHQSAVTALAWQSPTNQPLTDEHLLASAGDDGIISIWDMNGSDTKAKQSMNMESSVVALAFTHDGMFIAGATRNQILIWKIDELALPKACLRRAPENGWETPRSNGSDTMEYHHSLCWDTTDHKLAYGVANQLTIIDFNRAIIDFNR